MIRRNDDSPCPYGLPISKACSCIGHAIDRFGQASENMPGDDVRDLFEVNQLLFKWLETKGKLPSEPCKYAGKLFDNKDVVECNAGTEAAGIHEGNALAGSPLYYKMYSGIGIDGVYSFPLGYYADSTIDSRSGKYNLENPGASYAAEKSKKLKKSGNK